MTELRTTFSAPGIDRCARMRHEADALRRALDDDQSRFLPVWQGRCAIRGDQPWFSKRQELASLVATPDACILLGRQGERYLFAVPIESATPPGETDPAIIFAGLRELTTRLSAEHAGLVGFARAMVSWQQSHRFCGHCGARNLSGEAGFVMVCSNAHCERRCFPRLDPAIIVLVHRDDACLLGRQASWPAGRFSTIAGFVEPGERLEDAVRREVAEETDVRVGRCAYLGSQPWPFPAALMLGFHAEGLSSTIRLNDGELAEAQWLRRDEIEAGAVSLPPRASIAYGLIEAWFDAGPGARLASLGLDGPLLRKSRPGRL